MKDNLFRRMARKLGRAWPAGEQPFVAQEHDARPEPAPRPLRSRAYDERERATVWNKARPIVGWDPCDWRVDHRGNALFRHHYGEIHSAFGWDIGEIVPGGGEDLANLRPQLCHVPRPEASPFEQTFDGDRLQG